MKNGLTANIGRATAVVAAYNESRSIGRVLDVLLRCPSIGQIIVVDDGSTDSTASVARRKGVQVLVHARNRGKSEAVRTAIPKIRHTVVFLCDADLISLTPAICENIMRPVLVGDVVMSVGLHDYGAWFNALAVRFPSISGDRAVTKAVLVASTKSKYFFGYGMELVLDFFCLKRRLPVRQIAYTHHQLPTLKKRGFLRGIWPVLRQAALLTRIVIAMQLKGWH